MQCPVCSAVHEDQPRVCPRTDVPVPATLETILGHRRLSGLEVLRLGMMVCDHWRRTGVRLGDIRPQALELDYGWVPKFPTSKGAPEPEYVGVRALGGVLARCLDREDPASAELMPFFEEMAGAPTSTQVMIVRAEIHQLLSGGSGDPLEANTVADMPSPFDRALAPTVASSVDPEVSIAAAPADDAQPLTVNRSLTPLQNSADPYADTYIRPRSDLLPDASTDPTLNVSSMSLDDSLPSIRMGIPGPAAEPVPTVVRPHVRPEPRPPSRPVWTYALVLFGLAFVIVAGAVIFSG